MSQKQQLFMEAYASCEDKFTRYCQALTYGKMDSDDFIQDILLSTYQNFDKIQHKEQLLHYLIRAAKYKFIDKLRRKKYQTEPLENHQETLKYQGTALDISLDTQLMYQALAKLPAKQREAVILYEISGFSMKEIAQIQDSNVDAIKNKISRGRKKLAEILNDETSRKSSFLFLFALFNSNIFSSKATKFIQNLVPQTSQILAFIVTLCTGLAIGGLVVFQNNPIQNHIISSKEKTNRQPQSSLEESLISTNKDIENPKEDLIENQTKSVNLISSVGDKKENKIVLYDEKPKIPSSRSKSIDKKSLSIMPLKPLTVFSNIMPLSSQHNIVILFTM